MRAVKYLLAVLVTIAVAACGGGGGGGSSSGGSTGGGTPPPATYSISGTVSGNATSGVLITLSGASSATTTTATGGTYSFTGLANGSYTVTPTLAGNVFAPTSSSVNVSGANVPNTNFVATAYVGSTYSISGSTGVAGTTVALSGTAGSGSVLSGAGGAYTLSGLIPGSYTVTPTQIGYTFSPINTTGTLAASITGVNFTPTAVAVPHKLTGTVSGPASGVLITVTSSTVSGFTSASAVTATGGGYTVTGLYDGSYTVTPTYTGYSFNPISSTANMNGADLPGVNFAGTANPLPTALISGTVSGPWPNGVALTLSGATSGTIYTDSVGYYSFTGTSGSSYTITPALSGYSFSSGTSTPSITVPVPTGSSTPIPGQNFTQTPLVASYSVSGTVSYSGAQTTGPIMVVANYSGCPNCPLAATTLSAPGAYTIRGIPVVNSVTISAMMDTVGNGKFSNAVDPAGANATVISAAATGINITLADPTFPAPVTPNLQVTTGPTSAFLQWNPPIDAGGNEIATAYQINYGTTAALGTTVTVPAKGAYSNGGGMYFLTGLANASTLYVSITPKVGATLGTPSATVGPLTVGPSTAGTYTVSGTVTFSNSPTGPMYVGVYDQVTGTPYYTVIAAPKSPQSYTVTGVPASTTYYNFANIDMNIDHQFDDGDVGNTNGNCGSCVITVNGNVSTANLTLPLFAVGATSVVNTNYDPSNVNVYSAGYNVMFAVKNGLSKTIQSATIYSGPNIGLPFDMGNLANQNQLWVWTGLGTPLVGESYGIRVTYTDTSTANLTATVTGVLGASQVPGGLTVNSATPYSRTVPLFSWTAPASPPTPYTYSVGVYDPTGVYAQWWSNTMPSSQTSVVYNADGNSPAAALTASVLYNWQVTVQDANGNSANSLTSTYTP